MSASLKVKQQLRFVKSIRNSMKKTKDTEKPKPKDRKLVNAVEEEPHQRIH